MAQVVQRFLIKGYCSDSCLKEKCSEEHKYTDVAYCADDNQLYLVRDVADFINPIEGDFVVDDEVYVSVRNLIIACAQEEDYEALDDVLDMRDHLMSIVTEALSN